MVQNTKDTGKTIWLMVRASSCMFMVISMKENGNEIKPMAGASTPTVTEPNTTANGKMISSMAKALNHGTTIRTIRGVTIKARNTGSEPILGKMDQNIMETGPKIESMVKVNICGMMVDSIKVTGFTIIWTDMVTMCGKMAEGILGNTKTTKNMVKANMSGQMVGNTMENGKMGDNTGKAYMYQNKVFLEKAFGNKVRENGGLIT